MFIKSISGFLSAILLILITTSCSINPVNNDKNLPNSLLNNENNTTRAINTATVGRLTGVNWFGFETSAFVPHGLWARDYKSMIQQMKDLGFNCIRIPWCNDMLTKSPGSIQINAYGTDAYTKQPGLNTNLAGLTSLQVLDKIVEYAGTLGIKIILDNHSHAADGYMQETLWYTSACSEDKWISDWIMMVNRYKVYPNVIALDIKNEPHGGFLGVGMKPPATWGYNAPGYANTDWQAAAQRCANAIYAANPDIILVIQGVQEYNCSNYWWGGNLQGIKSKPITNIPKDHLWYSVHEYGPEVATQPWFEDPSFPNNMQAVWDSYYWYLSKENLATVYFGEVGIKEESATNPSSIPYKWLTAWLQYIGKSASWTFWCWNCDSGDTGGILKDDWVSVSTGKYNLIKPYLQPFSTASSAVSSTTASSSTAVSSSAASSVAVSSSKSSVASSAAGSSSKSSVASSAAVSSIQSSVASSAAVSSSRSSVASSTAVSSSQSSAASSAVSSVSGGYAVNYTINNDWGAGATVTVTIKNNTTTAVNGWALVWTFSGNQTITQIWTAAATQTGTSVSVNNLSYSGVIGANGGTTSFGFNLNYSGANVKPTIFTLNGTACTIY